MHFLSTSHIFQKLPGCQEPHTKTMKLPNQQFSYIQSPKIDPNIPVRQARTYAPGLTPIFLKYGLEAQLLASPP